MTATCRCGKPTRDAAYFCDDCGDLLTRALGDIPWLTEQIDISKTGEKGVDYRAQVTRSTEQPLPYRPGISDAAGHLRAVLVSWVRFCLEEQVRNQAPCTCGTNRHNGKA